MNNAANGSSQFSLPPLRVEETHDKIWVGTEHPNSDHKVGEVIFSLDVGEDFKKEVNQRRRATAHHVVKCVNDYKPETSLSEFESFVAANFPPGAREVVKKMRRDALEYTSAETQTAFVNMMQEAEARSAPTGKLTWTDEVPSESGWYWYSQGGTPIVVEVYREREVGMTAHGKEDVFPKHVEKINGAWAGPLPYPTD